MVFPGQNLPLPHRPFPFDPSVQVLPNLTTRLPLSPYCNPLSAQLRQPRCFPLQNVPILSLFCKHGFQKQLQKMSAHDIFCTVLFPHMFTQGRLHCTQHVILRTALQVLTRLVRVGPRTIGILPPSHNTRSPRKPGRILHAIGVRPLTLTPSIHPKLGVKSRHQGLHRCALQRIFRPFLEDSHPD